MPRHPDPRFQPDCTIQVDGRPVPARAGEPVAAALLAAGRPLLARSAKYHRPRGPFCLAGSCLSCQVRVDGLPGQRACRTPCREGLVVETQHGLPSAAHDLLGIIDLATPHGLDHHHLGTSSQLLDRAVVAISRRLAGLGRLPDEPLRPPPGTPPAAEPWEALVIGAGPAGLGAARALASGGRRVLLADGERRLGGRLRAELGLPGEPSRELADEVAAAVESAGGEPLAAASVLGLWLDGGAPLAVLALEAEGPAAAPRLRLVRPAVVVVCTGGTALPPAVADGDRPGVHWGRGLAVALAEHGTLPGRRVAILGGGVEATALATRLAACGVETFTLGEATRILGRARVRGLVAADGRRWRCDAAAVVAPPAPATELARHLGAEVRWDEECAAFALAVDRDGRTGVPGLFAAGEVTGAMGGGEALLAGQRAGQAALAALAATAAPTTPAGPGAGGPRG